MNGINIYVILHHVAEKMRISRDVWKADKSIFAGIVFSQFNGAENIIDRKRNIHNWQWSQGTAGEGEGRGGAGNSVYSEGGGRNAAERR